MRSLERVHSLSNLANQAALEYQYLVRCALWQSSQEYKTMGANDAAAHSETRAELNRLSALLHCDTDTRPKYSDLINPAPYHPEASYATERAVKAWKISEPFPSLVSNLRSSLPLLVV